MNGNPAEPIRRIEQKRAVSRTIEPLIERRFNSLIVLRENLRDSGTVNERAAIRAKARLILRAAGQRRVVSERRQTVLRAKRIDAIEERRCLFRNGRRCGGQRARAGRTRSIDERSGRRFNRFVFPARRRGRLDRRARFRIVAIERLGRFNRRVRRRFARRRFYDAFARRRRGDSARSAVVLPRRPVARRRRVSVSGTIRRLTAPAVTSSISRARAAGTRAAE